MTPQEVKDAVTQINREWNELRDLIKGQVASEKSQFGQVLGDTQAKADRISARLDEIEVKLARPGQGGAGDIANAAAVEAKRAAWGKILRKGQQSLSTADVEALGKKVFTVGDDTTGGFGATSEFDAEILKGVIDFSPVRELVTVRTTSKRSIKVMKRTGTFAAVWVGEVGTRSETTGLKYGLEEIPTHEIYALVDVSVQDLEDVDFDLEGELRQEFAEQFAVAEGSAWVNGTGNGKLEGIAVNAAIAQDTTGDAANLTYSGLVDVSHNVKYGYVKNARFIMNLKTLGKVRQMVDGTGNPLWIPLSSAAPSTILGYNYTIVMDLDDVGANKFPIFFGDFKRAYRLADRVSMEILRDQLTQATSGAVRFIARKRLGGQVVMAEALRKLKIA